MLHLAQGIVPILTSEAGSCLTSANWNEVYIHTASFYLEHLLMKPGRELLLQLDDFKSYAGWTGGLIINARNLVANKAGLIHLASPYDGSKLSLNYSELTQLIQGLKPDAVILPQKIVQDYPAIWDQWDNEIMPVLHATDVQELVLNRAYALYFDAQIGFEPQASWQDIPVFAVGSIPLELALALQQKGVQFIETDMIAADALAGLVYSQEGTVDLKASASANLFEVIDPGCQCPSCSQSFTKAYLHHLFHNTPLLCQRFLIQHNMYFAQFQQA